MGSSDSYEKFQQPILDILNKLYDDRVTKKDLERVEDKIERVEDKIDVRIVEVTSQIKELNDKTFCEQDSLGIRVNNLEKDSKIFKWVGSSILGVIITFIVITFKKLFS